MFLDTNGLKVGERRTNIETGDQQRGAEKMRVFNIHDGLEEIVPQLGPDTEYRTLGAHILATGLYNTQLKIIKQESNV